MDKKPFKIVFMGTPDFSVPALRALHESRHEVALVVTQPDRPKGRGRKLMPPPVKETALKLGYEVVQPETVRDAAFVETLNAIEPDLFIVIAFGHILSQPLLDLPRLGAVNIHASVLPRYRGSAPIQWAVINGEKETGVTAMFMDRGLDTGDILLVEKMAIGPDDTSGTLHDKLSVLGADLLIRTLEKFEADDIRPVPQDSEQATYAPLLTKRDGQIDWERPAGDIECLIRGVSPWPGAFTWLEGRRVKIFKARPVSTDTDAAPGTVIPAFPDELWVATGKGALSILEIQGASGKRLRISDFLRGCTVPPGTCLRAPDC
ncbi:methionyl-tRNA formyltransferase [Desulfonema ishimotonii]|uniref:Methionyl-tRNA formyltransferase n=1 Tax=Desulfonema ishimotonii TaxID=45657 RepID=A0A401FU65_9BACT|nr:methionyl-tRNA formyltransferase [Desulfonema ishimotonii]GBC60500.1 methionyl-tRNA formyltransferase [Desulfonema ishimotonii]